MTRQRCNRRTNAKSALATAVWCIRCGSDYVSASDSDGASVGVPTRAHRVNDRSASAFDMNAFARVLSQYTSQHVPYVNLTAGKVAAIAKSDKPKWDVKTEPFHTYKRRVMI